MSTRTKALAKTQYTPATAPAKDGLWQRKPLSWQPPLIQAELTPGEPLTIGRPDDKYEQEADRVADQVMRMPEPGIQRQVVPEGEDRDEEERVQPKALAAQITPLVQRQEVEGEEEEEEANEEEPIQAKPARGSTPRVGPRLAAQIRSLNGGGRPLSQAERGFFEPRFGYDFSKVRVHMGPGAAAAARSTCAKAFTVDQDIMFGTGRYAPETTIGKKLLAHELTHVLQQGRYDRGSRERVTAAQREARGQSIPTRPRSRICEWTSIERQPSRRKLILQRQPAQRRRVSRPARIQTLVVRWESLPNSVKEVLNASHQRWKGSTHPKLWMWRYYKDKTTAELPFSKTIPLRHRTAFRDIYNALLDEGLWSHVTLVRDIHVNGPSGIHFCAKSDKVLKEALAKSSHFCYDPMIIPRLRKLVSKDPPSALSYRQAVKAGSQGLHIQWNKPFWSAHLDTISPTEKRLASGRCSYSIMHSTKHLVKDLWGGHTSVGFGWVRFGSFRQVQSGRSRRWPSGGVGFQIDF